MQSLFTGWSRASQVAATAAGALMCLLIGTLIGVTAAGGHPQALLKVFTGPATADARTHKPHRTHNRTVTVTEWAQSPGASSGQTSPRQVSTVTVTQPPVTVTETVTETETETTPATVPAGGSSP
jgi:hypothetical protein